MFDNYCLVDVETTGGSPTKDRIIEIGIIRVENGNVVSEYKSLVNPQVSVSPFILELTGISLDEIYNAPTFEEIAQEVFDMLDGSVFVAHNVGFDYAFIKNEFRRLGVNYNSQIFCTARLSKALYPEYKHHNLSSIIERFSFNVGARHRAYDDAKVLYEFLEVVQKSFGETIIETARNRIIKTPYTNPLIRDEELDLIPEKCGVYIFYGETGMPLYIGKSINIKKRVMDHLRGIYFDSKEFEIWSQVARVDYKVTPGEISALILESELVRELMPLYNKMLRKKSSPVYLSWKTNEEGLIIPLVSKELEDHNPENILAVFKNAKRAKDYLLESADSHELCLQVVGLEKNPTKKKKACFRFYINKCCGICLDDKHIEEHNKRFCSALLKDPFIKPWPYNEVKLIREFDEDSGVGVVYKIDKWRILSTIEYFGDDAVERVLELPFDYDTYKIIYKALTKSTYV